MGELGFGMLRDLEFDLLIVTLVITNFLTAGADWKQPGKHLHLAHGLERLISGSMMMSRCSDAHKRGEHGCHYHYSSIGNNFFISR